MAPLKLSLILLLLAGIFACATPVGVKRASEREVYRQLTGNALSGEGFSPDTSQLLARLGLADQFSRDPERTLAELHDGLGGPDESSRLFALSELSHFHARESGDPDHYLAAALYAYAFLFPEDRVRDPLPYDPRPLLAMDLYNRSVANGLSSRGQVDLTPRRLPLPFGQLALSLDYIGLDYGNSRFSSFVSVDDFEIRGLRNHYRKRGVGAALMAHVEPATGMQPNPWTPGWAKVPVTAFIRFHNPREALHDGFTSATVEVYDVDLVQSVDIDGRRVPLETDPSASLAYRLEGSPLWDFGIAGFRRGDFNPFGRSAEGSLFFLTPYRPGRIPVVFVHGTVSSPARWAEMCNELLSDSDIASRYQFWFFMYNSGNPIALSAAHLREQLQQALRHLDPAGTDPALRRMVVIGHSQGGLLTKLTAIRSGNRFWENISREPFEKTRLPSETRDSIRRAFFIEPLPFVQRLVFLATPHHGAYMAENWIGKLGRRFVTLPVTVTRIGADIIKLDPEAAVQTALRIPTALDNMNRSNPFLRTLSSLPIEPGVRAHSIIAVKGAGPVETGKDGVVRFSSAHIDGVDSELVVRGNHSCQSNPRAIEEVRRILYLHAGLVHEFTDDQ